MNLQFKMPIGIGVSSLVMMFIALTMASIMSLTLMTSYRDYKLTQKEIESTKAYYAAEARANTLYLEIGDIYEIYSSASSEREDLMEKAFAEIDEITEVTLGQVTDAFVTYEVPINDKQNLQVVLDMQLQEESLKVKSWKIVQTNEGIYDDEAFGEVIIP